MLYFFFFKQKTAYEMRISDWSSDVCSSDLGRQHRRGAAGRPLPGRLPQTRRHDAPRARRRAAWRPVPVRHHLRRAARNARAVRPGCAGGWSAGLVAVVDPVRSEEHTSELQSLMRTSYAVVLLKKKQENT